MSSQDYCSDESLWGKGMYTSLRTIVEEYMAGLGPDNYTYDVERRRVLRQARNAIKQFNYSNLKN